MIITAYQFYVIEIKIINNYSYSIYRFETSAKDNTNIDDAARFLIDSILSIEEEHGSPDLNDDESERIHIDDNKSNHSGGGCC